MNRGQLYWVQLDKRRPAVLISPDFRNAAASDVIVIPCSLRLRPMRWHVALRRGEGGLLADSMAKCESVLTVPKSLLSPAPLGRELSPSRMREIEIALLSALGIAHL